MDLLWLNMVDDCINYVQYLLEAIHQWELPHALLPCDYHDIRFKRRRTVTHSERTKRGMINYTL